MIYRNTVTTYFFRGHKNVQVGSVSGSIIQEYGFADPDPKEIFTDVVGSTTLLSGTVT
jgi:hypothetical protein